MADNPPTGPGSSNRGRGSGRRRGRGGAPPGRSEAQHNSDGAGKGSKSRGRGGKAPGDRKKQKSDEGQQNNEAQPAATATVGTKQVAAATDDADDGEVCFICASAVEHTSVSPCNHRTCHICALRLRALYKNKGCAHCRTESAFVIFTDDPVRRFEEFDKNDFARTDDNLGIQYEKDDIFEDTVLLLRYNCPDEDCDVACLGWPDLHRHVKSKHGKVMCDLCTRNKKVFTHEHTLFTPAELRKHEKHGDDKPGAIDQSGFKGHPECGFCRQRFYGDDELYAHCRDKHERCHICDRRSSHRQQQYYVDYNALEGHFEKDHFLCLDPECMEKKFMVFESQMDLKGHQLEAHPNGVSKDIRRDARLVDLSEFDLRSPYQAQQRQRRGAGRGRDPNAEPLPVTSAQPLRRDQLAYQRQMEIQSAQSVSTRSFGGQLTRNETQTVRAPPRSAGSTPGPNSSRSAPPTAELENLTLATTSEPLSSQDQARRLRHTAVIERASNLLHNDATKLAEFRGRVSGYRTSYITAIELIDAFFSLFDTSSSELGKLIKELAEIYEEESKRSHLLQAWNDWRAINEDYPALPGPGGLLPGMSPSTVNTGGSRVLRLKHSTAKSSRSAVGRSGAMPSSSSSANPFPPLSAAAGPSSSRRNGSAASTPWASAAPPMQLARPSAPSAPSRSSSSTPTSSARKPAPSGADAFPSLPAAAKPNVMMAGKTRGYRRWDEHRGPAPTAWGSNPSSGAATPAEQSEFDFEDEQGDGKKGKKKKGKQTLIHFG
ncbi:hypothetical protein N7509_008817 [Penicillium cosmopolitanum]|uniref:RING-type E3 ubiquitin transferase n=1 Tax=Penicillium cosmopolitanum TaxID=1131564 RepID=A0A9W9VNA6_9EURO|nr:uncharacterized protein N7509_008817 [Penicillium cosmopolitanum]KAJ5386276.1 hypothetical protein N7509_008817 [Penicillium cosmopolitanum]